MKKIIAIVLVLMLSISILAACGGDEKLTGRYILTEISEDGETYKIEDYIKEMKAEYEESIRELKELYEEMDIEFDESEYAIDESDFHGYIEFLSDEKFKIFVFGMEDEGTFKVDGKSIEMTIDGETAEWKIDGKKLIFEEDDAKMIFEKK